MTAIADKIAIAGSCPAIPQTRPSGAIASSSTANQVNTETRLESVREDVPSLLLSINRIAARPAPD